MTDSRSLAASGEEDPRGAGVLRAIGNPPLRGSLPEDLRQALIASMDAASLDVTAVAAAVGVTPTSVSRILHGHARPSVPVAKLLTLTLDLDGGTAALLEAASRPLRR